MLALPKQLKQGLIVKGAIALTLSFGITSCLSKTKVVIVPPGEPVQLAEDIEAKVYTEVEKDGKTVRIKGNNRVLLRHGQWVISDPGPEENPGE